MPDAMLPVTFIDTAIDLTFHVLCDAARILSTLSSYIRHEPVLTPYF
jgi:hypothetical protein